MSRKTQIAFMINNLYGGGAEKILQTLISQLDRTVYDITLYGVKNETLDSSLYPLDIKYQSVYSSSESNNYFSKFRVKVLNKIKLFVYQNFDPKWFYKLFIKGNFDVEVAFIEGYSTKIISGSNQNSVKIAWVHIDLQANHWTEICYNNLQDEVESYQKYDHIVSVSKNVAEAFSNKFGIEDKLSVKYNPVNRNEILKKANITSSLPKKDKIRFISVGRLEPQKGYDRLLEVVNRLQKEAFEFELWIVGEGNKRKELEAYIIENKLQNIVSLHGFQSNPYQFIAASDIFVCSSRSEGFSTVVTEALILEKPVIATDCSGMKELLGENEYGLITKNNTESLYEGVKKMLSDPKLLDFYTEKSKQRSKDFDIQSTVSKIEALWKK